MLNLPVGLKNNMLPSRIDPVYPTDPIYQIQNELQRVLAELVYRPSSTIENSMRRIIISQLDSLVSNGVIYRYYVNISSNMAMRTLTADVMVQSGAVLDWYTLAINVTI